MKFVINNKEKDNNNLAFYTYAVKKSYEKIPNEKIPKIKLGIQAAKAAVKLDFSTMTSKILSKKI